MIKNLTASLVKKYNVQGPRYTSYPPAPSWSNDRKKAGYDELIDLSASKNSPPPISLYLHVPFCEKLCYFCGCTTFITGKNRSYESPYYEALYKELEWLAGRVGDKRPVVQFHLGGGTPTYMAPAEIEKLMTTARKLFSFDMGCEVGVEVDPRVTTIEHLNVLQQTGFNRLSMGVQDFNPETQKAINRVQPFSDTKALVENARRLSFESINIDLIYGLPHQTAESFKETIKQILSIGPDRLAVYSYAHVPWLKKQQDVFAKYLPTQEQKISIFLTALEEFAKAGFDYIGMDHFAKPTDELAVARKNKTLWRNFMGYTTKAGTDLFGVGMSAISSLQEGFAQNEKTAEPYQSEVMANGTATIRGFRLSQDDKIRGRLIQSLLCHADVNKEPFERDFGIEFDSYFSEALKGLRPLEQDGLVKILPDRIVPTETGRVFLRNLAMPFDAYLPKPGEKRVFSRTV